ncbi:hypothetical protein IEQ34_013343 [Dendrobium chrysotoxum]|uniref:alcohol dehydrogenase n=1 Tax=Dendrobium chrysotoxum TaxID=161865 RepID=A0AAV7GR41_DENCH|nr:hypothetical protein IEQ34_013343 [Dendrobium chrysotoxum]
MRLGSLPHRVGGKEFLYRLLRLAVGAEGESLWFSAIPGGEAPGSGRRIVESIGEGVTNIAHGDHVLLVFTGKCKECSHDNSKKCIMCSTLRNNTDCRVIGKPIYHFVGTSTFSEYTVVHVGCVAKIDPEAPLDKVCILSCGVSIGKIFQLHLFLEHFGLFYFKLIVWKCFELNFER